MKSTIVFLTFAIGFSTAQLYFHQLQPLQYQPSAYPSQRHIHIQPDLAHKSVVENAIREAQLPPELTNNFYKNPRVAAALAKESWLTDKEMPVFDREAEKIPRDMIYKIFKNAGWVRRR
ncbi:uncharacterized protein LOC129947714 [Eupeodes corollae]|uniref:uncharacterized protein LOC129947714 n=1 Tax=Eupeodes corollae TaxID=290404 RepID=UPI002492C563|nr:uncharacterized protein LOC129947714 [Eupeodes corollae]XP_055914352.1 uncharacterized protein LOC129947714 [Eupeodes corollae]XP_055914353.1 uncharacterized protein LOC129947714 [Eupeodes corollae]